MRSSLLAATLLCVACAQSPVRPDAPAPTPSAVAGASALELVASSPRQWAGVAVSKEGRVFVELPRWSDDVPVSVAEVKGGALTPWPDATWNAWTPKTKEKERFVAVQSVFVDDQDRLWVLDTANPQFQGVVTAPQLHQFDIASGRLLKSYAFPPGIYSGEERREKPSVDSYLNDVRVDTREQVAYLTDSQVGGLVVLDLKTGVARRVLDDHPSTHAEVGKLTIQGRPFTRQIQSDGIALTPDGQTLYWAALSGHTLWRIPTALLRDASLDARSLANRVERVEGIGATDGMLFDSRGTLWLGGLEDGSIHRFIPGKGDERFLQDARLRWPDSFAEGPGGSLYVTTSQIHLTPAERGPYELFRFTP